jgi:hypothetical protein
VTLCCKEKRQKIQLRYIERRYKQGENTAIGTERKTDRHTETETNRDRQRDSEREREKQRETDREHIDTS